MSVMDGSLCSYLGALAPITRADASRGLVSASIFTTLSKRAGKRQLDALEVSSHAFAKLSTKM